MNIEVMDLKQLDQPGVYKILNVVNGHYYIGSTKMTLKQRLDHHYYALQNNNHKNAHLLRAWNKYGKDNFKFIVLECCTKDIVYDREQFYLDNRDIKLSYNINPKATGFSNQPETQEKLRISHLNYYKIARSYYDKLRNNEITLDEVPEKYSNTINLWINHVPWNKGITYESTEHLKVKHRFTEKSRIRCQNFSEKRREEADVVYVYDEHLNFVDSFRSTADLVDLSKYLKLPLNSRFKVKRGNCELNELRAFNINKAIKNGTTYKGLYFRTLPLHPGMDDVNEPKSVKNWNVNTEVSIETKESMPPYSIGTEPGKSE